VVVGGWWVTIGEGVVWGVVMVLLGLETFVDDLGEGGCWNAGRGSMLKKFLKGSKSVGKGLLLEYTFCVLVLAVPW